jgi:hypothetical protein
MIRFYCLPGEKTSGEWGGQAIRFPVEVAASVCEGGSIFFRQGDKKRVTLRVTSKTAKNYIL